jgi:hypothetical protein
MKKKCYELLVLSKKQKTFTIPTLDAVKRTNPQIPFLKIYQQNNKGSESQIIWTHYY